MATTNGKTIITVGGKEYLLHFGRAAVEEMSHRAADRLTPNRIKMFTDLIYSGMMNSAIATDTPFPSYPEVYELIEDFQDEEDASEQQTKIWNVFEQSRWGAEWIKKLEETKKKVDLAVMEMEKAEAKPESTGNP